MTVESSNYYSVVSKDFGARIRTRT